MRKTQREIDMIAMHPGEYLSALAKDLDITQTQVADRAGVAQPSICRLMRCKSSMTPALALKLEAAFDYPAESWLQMQNLHDLKTLRGSAKNE